ncbi:hypothetical protein BGY98DRAFT_261594 [Russula aff. rugulosa BPL654]|nr:hypothetical protein BGY98DRAFT_261594 [Russula aff. rugulosa BPL654]
MRVFNFSLIAVLSCIAMIGAIPVENNAPAQAIARREDYCRRDGSGTLGARCGGGGPGPNPRPVTIKYALFRPRPAVFCPDPPIKASLHFRQ